MTSNSHIQIIKHEGQLALSANGHVFYTQIEDQKTAEAAVQELEKANVSFEWKDYNGTPSQEDMFSIMGALMMADPKLEQFISSISDPD